jgi:hypothetical protein
MANMNDKQTPLLNILSLVLVFSSIAFAPFEDVEPVKKPATIVVPNALLQHPPQGSLVHKIGRKAIGSWEKNVLPTLNSVDQAQTTWTPTSMWGVIFTYGKGDAAPIPLYEDPNAATVTFNLPPSHGFVEFKAAQKLWQSWLEENPSVPNHFPSEQVARLKEGGWPYHSEFYRQNHLAGTVDSHRSPPIWMLVDLKSVNAISVEVPGRVVQKIVWNHKRMESTTCKIPLEHLSGSRTNTSISD